MKTIFVYFFISTLFSLSLSKFCNSSDKKVLLQIKQDFGYPYLLASWKSNTDCCTYWYQVQCDSTTHRITSLTIFDGDLSGQIPPEIGDLPYLQMLDFSRLTNITGPIRPTISKVKNLTFLRLNLTGSVPDSLSQLKNLTFLDLSSNSLSGSIPNSLSLLQNLDALHLDRNQLTGTIPESFGAFKGKVPSLYLSHNQLSGKIPASLGNMDFDDIDLSQNKLEGDASMLFGQSKSTQTVDISRNVLEFNLSKVVFPCSLTNLYINHNKIYGGILEKMTKINLQFLNVSYNMLCGQIPVGGKLQSFDSSTYFHNQCLSGAPLESCK